MSKMKELLEINRQKNLIKDFFENQINYEDVQFIFPDENSIPPVLVGYSEEEALKLKSIELDSLIYRQYRYTGMKNIFNEVNKEDAYAVIYEKFRSAIFHKGIFKKKFFLNFITKDVTIIYLYYLMI